MDIKLIRIDIMHNEYGLLVWLLSLVVSATLVVLFFVFTYHEEDIEKVPSTLGKFKLYFEKLPSEDSMMTFRAHAQEKTKKAAQQTKKKAFAMASILIANNKIKIPTKKQGIDIVQ